MWEVKGLPKSVCCHWAFVRSDSSLQQQRVFGRFSAIVLRPDFSLRRCSGGSEWRKRKKEKRKGRFNKKSFWNVEYLEQKKRLLKSFSCLLLNFSNENGFKYSTHPLLKRKTKMLVSKDFVTRCFPMVKKPLWTKNSKFNDIQRLRIPALGINVLVS